MSRTHSSGANCVAVTTNPPANPRLRLTETIRAETLPPVSGTAGIAITSRIASSFDIAGREIRRTYTLPTVLGGGTYVFRTGYDVSGRIGRQGGRTAVRARCLQRSEQAEAMRTFFWEFSMDERLPKTSGMYDYKNSSFISADVLSPQLLERSKGTAIFRFPRWSLKALRSLHCPPVIETQIVDQTIIEIIRRFSSDEEVSFYPVECVCKDGVCHDYSFVVPRHRLRCVDLEQSIVEVEISHGIKGPRPYIQAWDHLILRPDCLEGRHIAREDYLAGRIIVSEALKDALSALDDPSLYFVLPRDLRWT
jgi:hypothetical protein